MQKGHILIENTKGKFALGAQGNRQGTEAIEAPRQLRHHSKCRGCCGEFLASQPTWKRHALTFKISS
jgi:hypothetical protein